MNYMLILGVIGIIALIGVAAYFFSKGGSTSSSGASGSTSSSGSSSGCSSSIDGKYGNNLDELFVAVGNNQTKVLIMMKAARQGGGSIMAPAAEFQISKAQDPITIDNKQTDVYKSTNLVFGKYIFLARNPTTCGISFYKMGTSSYEKLPDLPVELRKVE